MTPRPHLFSAPLVVRSTDGTSSSSLGPALRRAGLRPPVVEIDEVVRGRLRPEATPAIVPRIPPIGAGRAVRRVVGHLVDADTGAPVSGLRVTAWVRSLARDAQPAGDGAGAPGAGVGEARSDGRGFFAIELAAGDDAGDALALMEHEEVAELVLRVERAVGEPYMESDPIDPGGAPVTLRVPLPKAEPDGELWSELADRLEESRVLRIDQVARELAGRPSPDSPFADWGVERRQAVLDALERNFLDPDGVLARHVAPPTFGTLRELDGEHELTRALLERADDEELHVAAVEALGKLASFDGLRSVDWLVDTHALRSNRPGQAVTSNQVAKAAAAATSLSELLAQVQPVAPGGGPRVAYRDYLRAILCGASRTQGFADLHGRLADRLHQRFLTTDDAARPANEIAVPILLPILKAPRQEGYGFGIPAAQIEAQGARSPREYLDHLIGLAGVGAEELRRRYHVDFGRPDSDESSPVQQNLDTLQSFLRDAFQARQDPHDPIVPTGETDPRRRQPFFLYYPEWLEARKTFFPENHYPLRETFSTVVTPEGREQVEAVAASSGNAWFLTMLAAEDAWREANELADKGSYGGAAGLYLEARKLAYRALDEARSSKAAQKITGKFDANPLSVLVRPAIDQLATLGASDADELEELVQWLVPDLDKGWSTDPTPEGSFLAWMDATFPRHLLSLLRLGLELVPACLGDVSAEVGDFASSVAWYGQATMALTMLGALADESGWPRHLSLNPAEGDTYHPRWHAYTGELPFGFASDGVGLAEVGYPGAVGYHVTGWAKHAQIYRAEVTPAVEQSYLRLRYGEALLGWADALYRTDEEADIQRARELYKAVLLLHGERPPIDPNWPKASRLELGKLAAQTAGKRFQAQQTTGRAATVQLGSRATMQRVAATASASLSALGAQAATATATAQSNGGAAGTKVTAEMVLGVSGLKGALSQLPGFPGYAALTKNPARQAQITRASLGIFQIGAGLNAYGLRDDLVPALRYRPLKEAADHFAAAARAAQDDLLHYLGAVEDALKEQIVSAHVLRKARLQSEIAGEQVGLAKYTEGLARQQIRQVEKRIEEKREELEDEKSFWGQVGNFFEGFVGAIKDLPDDLVGTGGSGAAAVAGYGSYQGSGALAGLGAGGAAMAGYGIVVYAGVSSMLEMEAALDSLVDQIHHLEGPVMYAAQGQLAAKQRETKIAQLQQAIAANEVALAKDLIAFESKRFLNVEFWDRLADMMKRILRRYLDLGTRYAWLAERALAYEQDRTLDVIRLDYMPRQLAGITGADLLKQDLGELEAARLDGVRKALPITHTYSLAFDFPLQLAELRRTGRCTFRTPDGPFRRGHPGTYGHRVLAVTGRLVSRNGAAPFRGILTNAGHSLVSGRDGRSHLSLRPVEGLPVSEFRLRRDREVFGLPDETLYAFEGSGVDTTWTLELPDAGNPYGRRDLLDVELTVDVRAHYSAELHETDRATPPPAEPRLLMLSARRLAPAALQALADGAQQVAVPFDLAALDLPDADALRIGHAVLLVAGGEPVEGIATVSATGLQVDVTLAAGVATSYPTADDAPPSALTQLSGAGAAQTVTVTLDATRLPAVDLAQLRDVVLGVQLSPTTA